MTYEHMVESWFGVRMSRRVWGNQEHGQATGVMCLSHRAAAPWAILYSKRPSIAHIDIHNILHVMREKVVVKVSKYAMVLELDAPGYDGREDCSGSRQLVPTGLGVAQSLGSTLSHCLPPPL